MSVGILSLDLLCTQGAKRVIAVDYIDYRLKHAKRTNKVETVNFEEEENVGEYLRDMTDGGAQM
ncbi:hypothetical protein GCM10020331_070100 [Ectobacillus funiculus]